MKGKDFGIILVLVLSICNGRGLVEAIEEQSERTNFGRGNFFQDKFCDVFCPKDDSQPRLTLTDDQIQTILDSDEIVQMLEQNPDLLHNSKDLDTACLIQFNDDQRDTILTQYGGFFSTPDEVELLAASANRINSADNVELDSLEQEKLDAFLEVNNPARNTDDTENSANAGDAGDTNEKGQEDQKESHNSIYNYHGYYSQGSSSGSGSRSSGSGSSVEWLNRYYDSSGSSGSDSGGRHYYGSSGSSGSYSGWGRYYGSYGSDSRRRRKRRKAGDSIIQDVKREQLRRSPEDRQKLLEEFIRKNSKRKRSLRRKPQSRGKRGSEEYIPLCNAEINLEAITLALTADKKLVQIPQFPETELYQWFIKETCSEETSSVISGVSCNRTSRTERAIVLDLQNSFDDQLIFEGYIEIESCSAFATASNAEKAQVVEEPTLPPTEAPSTEPSTEPSTLSIPPV